MVMWYYDVIRYDTMWFCCCLVHRYVDYEFVISERLFNWLWTRLNNWLQTIKSLQSNNNSIVLRFVVIFSAYKYTYTVHICGAHTHTHHRFLIQLHQIQILSIITVSFHFIQSSLYHVQHILQRERIKSSNFY